jgi:hypothetical protein
MRAGRLPLLDHRHRYLAEALAHLGTLLEELGEPDGGGEAGWARADDERTDFDAFVRWIGRLRNELLRIERRRKISRADAHEPFRWSTRETMFPP